MRPESRKTLSGRMTRKPSPTAVGEGRVRELTTSQEDILSSNLHSGLMSPKPAELWVAYATTTGEPASEQPYTYLNVKEIMAKEPGR